MGTFLAKLQSRANVVLKQPVLGAELAVAVGAIAHHSERRQGAAFERAPVFLGLLLGGRRNGDRRQPRQRHGRVGRITHENDGVVGARRHAERVKRLVERGEFLAVVNQLVVGG